MKRCFKWGFPGVSVVKNLIAMQETQEMWVGSLCWEDLLKKGMTTHCSIFSPGGYHGQKSLAGFSP